MTGAQVSCQVIQRQISVGSTDGVTPLNFQVTAQNAGAISWLYAAPNTGTTPDSITVLIDPSGLTPGVYYGTITVGSSSSGASGTSGTSGTSLASPFSIPVTLTVTAANTSSARIGGSVH